MFRLGCRGGGGSKMLRHILYSEETCMIILSGYKNLNTSSIGVSLMNVEKMNLLTLAPGGHVGRFCIWTEGALGKVYLHL